MDRQKELERLTRVQMKGRQAEQAREALLPLFESVQKDYILQLLTNTREKGEVSSSEVWKLVALDDLHQSLIMDIAKGAQASRSLKNITERGGND